MERDRFRQMLLSERQSVLKSLGWKVDGLAQGGPVGDEDLAQISYDEFVALAINRIDFAKLRQIDESLARIDDGDYGNCLGCGEPIPEKRLSAIPWARYCIPCQEEHAALEAQEREEERRNRDLLFASL